MQDRVPEKVSVKAGEPLDLTLLEHAPSGAFALAGAAVALLVIAWLIMYALVFVPRGTVG